MKEVQSSSPSNSSNNNTSNSKPQQIPKLCVRFPSKRSIQCVEYVDRIGDDDHDIKNNIWCNEQELNLRRHRIKCDIRDWTRGRRNSDNMTFSSLGLEGYVGKGKLQKLHARQIQMDTIRTELYEQWLLHQSMKQEQQQLQEQQQEHGMMEFERPEQQHAHANSEVPISNSENNIVNDDDFSIDDDELAAACEMATQYSRDKAHADALELQRQVENIYKL